MKSSDEFLNFTPDEILFEAIMGQSLIIVEGENDYIYEDIADSVKIKKYKVEPIGNLIGKSGNLALESLILEIEKFAKEEGLDYIPHILGIIDRDYREYEERLTKSDILFILDLHSIESYFVNKEVLYNSLEFSIRSKRLMDDGFVNLLYSEIRNKLVENFYSQSIKKLKKHLEIDEVVDKFKFSKSIEILLKITKGKDLLTRFLVEIQDILSPKNNKTLLYKLCRDKKVALCPKHHDEEHEKFCLYITQKYDVFQLRNITFKQIDIKSLTPIKKRISQLK